MTFLPQKMFCANVLDDVVKVFNKPIQNMIESAFDIFSSAIKFVFNLLSIDPTGTLSQKGVDTASWHSIWNKVSGLYDTFSVIGYSLVVLFFLYGFLRDTVDIRQELHLESIIKLFIRFIITINVMNAFITYVPQFCHWAIDLLGVTSKTFTFDSKGIAKKIVDQYDIAAFFIGLLLFILCFACAILVIYTCFGRLINFYLLIPFGSIALSTLAGGGQLSQTGFSYIKSLLVYTFEIVAMGVVLAISGVFINSSVLAKGGAGANWLIVEVIVKMITVVAALKGADATIKKAFNM